MEVVSGYRVAVSGDALRKDDINLGYMQVLSAIESFGRLECVGDCYLLEVSVGQLELGKDMADRVSAVGFPVRLSVMHELGDLCWRFSKCELSVVKRVEGKGISGCE